MGTFATKKILQGNPLQKLSKCKKHLFCELLPKTALFSP